MASKALMDACREALTNEPEPVSVIYAKMRRPTNTIRRCLEELVDMGEAEKVPIFRRSRANGRPALVGWRKVSSSESINSTDLEPCLV